MKNFKKYLLIALTAIVALSLAACSKKTDGTTTKATTTTTTIGIEDPNSYKAPKVTEGSKVEFQNSNVTITKDEVYKMVKYYAGVATLTQMIDEQLLASEIATIGTDNEFYISRYNRTVYGVEDPSTLTAEEKAEMEEEFVNTMYMMGYKDGTAIQSYVKLLAARDRYAYNEMLAGYDNKKSDYYLTDEVLEKYYNADVNAQMTADVIIVNYYSYNDYRNALANNGIITFDAEFYNADPTVPARKYSSETITDKVSDVKAAFETLYTGVYGSTDAVKTYTYETLSAASSTIAEMAFDLEDGEYTYMVTKNTLDYGTVYTLIYKVSEASGTAYDATANRAETAQKYISEKVKTVSNVTAVMATLRSDNKIKFYDAGLAYDYYYQYDTSFSYKGVTGDNAKLVTCGSITITADDFYEYCTKNSMEYYVFYAAVPVLEQGLSYYATIYGAEKDLTKNESLRIKSFKETIEKNYQSAYKSATYESTAMYYYRTYGFDNVEDIVKYYYVANDLRYMTVLEMLYTNGVLSTDEEANFQAVIDKIYDGYYKFTAYKLDVYIDADNDLKADDMTQASGEVTALIDELYTYITNRVGKVTTASATDATTEIKKFIKAYNDADRNYTGDDEDLQAYAKFKKAGLIISYVSMGSVDYVSSASKYSDAINSALNKIFISDDMPDSASELKFADSFAYDENGAHLLYVTNGSKISFSLVAEIEDEQPKYEYDQAYYNDADKATVAQLAKYYYYSTFKTLFTDDKTAQETYGLPEGFFPSEPPEDLTLDIFTTTLDSYYVSETYINSYFIDLMKGGKFDTEYTRYLSIYASFLGSIVE